MPAAPHPLVSLLNLTPVLPRTPGTDVSSISVAGQIRPTREALVLLSCALIHPSPVGYLPHVEQESRKG